MIPASRFNEIRHPRGRTNATPDPAWAGRAASLLVARFGLTSAGPFMQKVPPRLLLFFELSFGI
jgi:hypothetical protein